MTIDRNLELIINEDMDVIAYRYDYSDDMKSMVKDNGKWRFTDEGKALSDNDKLRLKLICFEYLS